MDDNNALPEEDSELTVEDVLNNLDKMRDNIREMSKEVIDLRTKTTEAELRLTKMKKLLEQIEAGKKSIKKSHKK